MIAFIVTRKSLIFRGKFIFEQHFSIAERDARYTKWKMAVQRSLGWSLAKKSAAMTGIKARFGNDTTILIHYYRSYL